MSSEDEEFTYSAGELSDDEEQDVDWEDVNNSQQASEAPATPVVPPSLASKSPQPDADAEGYAAPQDQEEKPQEPQDLQQIDWNQINQALQQQDAAAVARKRRRKPIRLSKDEKLRERALHQSHLLVLLGARMKWSRLAGSQLLRGLMLSVTAQSDIDFFAEMTTQPLPYSLELLVRWFRQEFELTDEEREPSCELVTESSLMDALFSRKGRDYELIVLFIALCGGLQLRCRLTSALDAVLVQKGKVFESSFKERPSKRRRGRQIKDSLLKRRAQGDAEQKEEINEDAASTETDQVFWLWCEVLDETSKSWIHVDPVRRLVNLPLEVEPLRGKAARFSYVLSIQEDGLLVDVTSRYTTHWSKNLELRLADSWLKRVIEQVNEEILEQRGPTAMSTDDGNKLLQEEKQKLETLKLAEGMPTSVEGFRKHHVYCLERHLTKSEVLHPRKVVGLFNGQPVFLRGHIQPVQSAFKWRRLGREVKPSEREKPAKWQTRGDNPDAGASDSDSGGKPGGPSLALFGLWQTTAYEPAPMVNGRVPKNKYGNMEIWSPAHVPRGAVHLQLPRIDAVAESLGIDFAPAVVGFEMRNGRTMPKFAGIVVAQTAEATLLDAHAAKQQANIERAIAHNQKLVIKRWEKLTKRLLLRQRLEDDYGVV